MKTRKQAYDLIRIVALAMIVMVHVSAYMVIFFPDTAGKEWLVGNIFNGLARAGVPLFIMLSGALLLNEEKPFSPRLFYRKSLVRMALLAGGWMLFYGVIYAVVFPAMEGKPLEMAAFWGFLLRFQGSEYPHLWYMLMVIGMYLMIPVLRLFVKKENKAYVIGMMWACVVVQFAARTADYFTLGSSISVSQFMGKFHLEPATGFLFYLLMGWYLGNFEMKAAHRRMLYGAGVAAVVISTAVVHHRIDAVPGIRDYMYSELSLPAMVYGVALFVLIQSLCRGKTTKSGLVRSLSDGCFGVYLVHVVVMEVFVRYLLPYECMGPGRPLCYILLLYGFTLGLSAGIVWLSGRCGVLRRAFYNR